VDGCIIPVEKPLPGWGLHDVHGVNLCPSGWDVGLNETPAIKEGHHNLFAGAGHFVQPPPPPPTAFHLATASSVCLSDITMSSYRRPESF
jgi:hypothetical protein